MNAAKKSVLEDTTNPGDPIAALGRKIDRALAQADELGLTVVAIRLQEALDAWRDVVERQPRL